MCLSEQAAHKTPVDAHTISALMALGACTQGRHFAVLQHRMLHCAEFALKAGDFIELMPLRCRVGGNPTSKALTTKMPSTTLSSNKTHAGLIQSGPREVSQEEHGSDRDALCTVQSVNGAPCADANTGSPGVSGPKNGAKAAKGGATGILWGENLPNVSIRSANCTIRKLPTCSTLSNGLCRASSGGNRQGKARPDPILFALDAKYLISFKLGSLFAYESLNEAWRRITL
jgi:hypothetical protein